jgi:hypothetical protein
MFLKALSFSRCFYDARMVIASASEVKVGTATAADRRNVIELKISKERFALVRAGRSSRASRSGAVRARRGEARRRSLNSKARRPP